MDSTDDRNRDFERLWFGNKQVSVCHFYSIGVPEGSLTEWFACGYYTPDGIFHQGFVVTDTDGNGLHWA